jgi:hypothetical protein
MVALGFQPPINSEEIYDTLHEFVFEPPVKGRHCQFCGFWVRGEDTSFGGCSSPKFNRAGDVPIDTDGVELGGWALFGEDFGCVHWESISPAP